MVLAFITSQIPGKPLDTDILIQPGDPDFAATGLRVSSALQLHRLMTVSTSLIHRQLGRLSPALQERLAAGLRGLFGLG